jgi:Na+-driven multidrug efflux pump
LAGPIYLLSPTIARILLGDKPDMIVQTITLLRYLCVTEVLFAYAMIVIGAMQGAGDTVRPMWISIFSLWGLRA